MFSKQKVLTTPLFCVILNLKLHIRFHNSESFLFNKIEKIAEDKFRCTGYGAPGFTRVYTGKLLHSDPTWNSYFDSGKYPQKRPATFCLNVRNKRSSTNRSHQNKFINNITPLETLDTITVGHDVSTVQMVPDSVP